jgi:hypothetical protein
MTPDEAQSALDAGAQVTKGDAVGEIVLIDGEVAWIELAGSDGRGGPVWRLSDMALAVRAFAAQRGEYSRHERLNTKPSIPEPKATR